MLLFKRVVVYHMYIYTTINTMYTGRQIILFWTNSVIPETKLRYASMQSNSHNFFFSNIANIDIFLYDLLKQVHCWVVPQPTIFVGKKVRSMQERAKLRGTRNALRMFSRAEHTCSSLWCNNFSFVKTPGNARSAQRSMRGTRNAPRIA